MGEIERLEQIQSQKLALQRAISQYQKKLMTNRRHVLSDDYQPVLGEMKSTVANTSRTE